MRAPTLAAIATALITLRLATLPWSGFSQEYAYLEAHYATLARGLHGPIPTLPDGTEIHNTPPLYAWLLSLWGNLFGWQEATLRLPSAIAWALTAIPVHGLARRYDPRAAPWAAIAWLTLPLGFVLAGKAIPDMLLTSLLLAGIHTSAQGRIKASLLFATLAVLTKPTGAIGYAPVLLDPRHRTKAILCIAAAAATTALLGGLPMVLTHLQARGTGHWGLTALARDGILIGSATTLAAFTPIRTAADRALTAPLWAGIAALAAFTLYAMPDWGTHHYYWIPAAALLTAPAGANLQRWPSLPRLGMLAMAVATLLVLSTVNGDLWDTRIRDATAAYDIQAAADGMRTVTAWYEHRWVPDGDGPSLTGATVPDGCTVVQAYPARTPWDGPIHAVQCDPVRSQSLQ